MTNINLYQSPREVKDAGKARTANGGFIFSLGILVVAFLVLGGLKVAASVLTQRNNKMLEEVNQENVAFAGWGSIEKIVDMQVRLGEIKNRLKSEASMKEILGNLGEDMTDGVTVTSYKYEGGKVTLSLKANNYSDVSKQIVMFKGSENFNDATLVDIARGESGITFGMKMSVK